MEEDELCEEALESKRASWSVGAEGVGTNDTGTNDTGTNDTGNLHPSCPVLMTLGWGGVSSWSWYYWVL